jgi:hypothetical protein
MNTKLRALFETFGPGSPTRYLSDTETLRLTVFNAATGVRVALRGRKVDENGESRFASNEITPTTARAASIVEIQPGAGWLVGAAALVIAGTPLDGQTYAVLSIGIGTGNNFTETEVLAAGTISSASHLSWPGSPVEGPLDGAGALRSITGTTPGAGAEISEVVPTGARWELLATKFGLTTNATVANRDPALSLDDGANEYFRQTGGASEAASTTFAWSWGQGVSWHGVAVVGTLANGLPVNLRMGSGHRMRTITANLQVGDQYTAPQMLVREWIEGN